MTNYYDAYIRIKLPNTLNTCGICGLPNFYALVKDDICVFCKNCETIIKLNVSDIINEKVRIVDVLWDSGEFKSKGEIKRLITQNAISFGLPDDNIKNFTKVDNIDYEIYKYLMPEKYNSYIFKFGKHRFLRIKLAVLEIV